MSNRHVIASGFFKAVVALKTAWERRRVVGQLGALDDHMLRDIGITRQDVLSVLAEPLYSDPSVKLAERAAAARDSNREAARDLYLVGASPRRAA